MPKPFLRTALFPAAAALFAACAPPDVEVGPYTVSVIEKNVYHIQDCNQSNPAGETFDAEGKLTHFNNCSDIYLLVGRQLEVLFTPGHTAGSVTFFDKERHYGFSGDAFGSTNLLLFGTFRQLLESTERTMKYMEDKQIRKLYPGHYSGNNPETPARITGENTMARELLSGRRKGIVDENRTNGLNRYVRDYGTYIRYNDPEAFN